MQQGFFTCRTVALDICGESKSAFLLSSFSHENLRFQAVLAVNAASLWSRCVESLNERKVVAFGNRTGMCLPLGHRHEASGEVDPKHTWVRECLQILSQFMRYSILLRIWWAKYFETTPYGFWDRPEQESSSGYMTIPTVKPGWEARLLQARERLWSTSRDKQAKENKIFRLEQKVATFPGVSRKQEY